MSNIDYDELRSLSAEFLPERKVLSIISIDNSRYIYNFPEGSGGDGGGSTVAYACQAERVDGTPGLLGSLGLGSNNPSSSMTCVPGTVTTH